MVVMGEIWSGFTGRTAAGAVTTGAWRSFNSTGEGSSSVEDDGEGVGSEREDGVEAGEGE